MKTEMTYADALKNLSKNKSDMTFSNSGVSRKLETLKNICETTNEDLFIYEKNLNNFIHNDEIFISSLKKVLQNDRKIFIILHDGDYTEEFLKLYKIYGSEIKIKKVDDEFMSNLSSVLNPEKVGNSSYVDNLYFTGNQYSISIKSCDNDEAENYSVNNFNNSRVCNMLKTFFDKHWNRLEKIETTQNKKMPESSEVIEKFKHLNIEEKDMYEIINFIKGKKNDI